MCMLSCQVVSDSVTPWTAACQAPLSMGFPRQDNTGVSYHFLVHQGPLGDTQLFFGRCGLSHLNSPGTKQVTTPPHRAALGSSAGVHHGAGPLRLKREGRGGAGEILTVKGSASRVAPCSPPRHGRAAGRHPRSPRGPAAL